MSVPVTVGVAAGIVSVGAIILGAGASVVEHHEAAGVADSAALAAADALFGWIPGEPCEVASLLSKQAGKKIEICEISRTDVVVGVRRSFFNGVVKARAGM